MADIAAHRAGPGPAGRPGRDDGGGGGGRRARGRGRAGRRPVGGPARRPAPGRCGSRPPARLRAWPLQGLSVSSLTPGEVVLLLADPFTLPVDAVVEALAALDPPVPVVGRRRLGARVPGGNRLVLDGDVSDGGGVGVVLPAEVATTRGRVAGVPSGRRADDRHRRRGQPADRAGRPAGARAARGAGRSPPAPTSGPGSPAGSTSASPSTSTGRRSGGATSWSATVVGADREARALAVGERGRGRHDRPVPGPRRRRRRRGPPGPAAPGRRGDGALAVHLQRPGRAAVRRARPRRRAWWPRRVGSDAVAGMFCAGEVGPGRRPELPARVHRQRRRVPRPDPGPAPDPGHSDDLRFHRAGQGQTDGVSDVTESPRPPVRVGSA